MWRVKRRSALDRHAAFVKRLERQRLAREKSRKASAGRCRSAAWFAHSYITLLCAWSVCFAHSVYLWQTSSGRSLCCIVQEGAESKVNSESRLHSFTKKLRHAILHNADVASVWRPAVHMLDVKATLDRKLNEQWFARAASQVAACLLFHSSTLCHKLTPVHLLVCRSLLHATE